MLIECKFSADPGYVGRNGYEQLLAYMTEAKTSLARTVAGVLVGPAEVIEGPTLTTTAAGPIAVTPPACSDPASRGASRDHPTGVLAASARPHAAAEDVRHEARTGAP